VPDTALVNVHGAGVSNLNKLSDYHGTIYIRPESDETLPGGQKALLNHTQETLAMISTPTGKTNGAPYESVVDLVISKYVKNNRAPTAVDFSGAVILQQFNDSIADMSYQKMAASNKLVGNDYKALLNADTVRYDCRFHQIMDTKLKSRVDYIMSAYYKQNKDAKDIAYLIDNGLSVVMTDGKFETLSTVEKVRLIRSWGFIVTEIQFVMKSFADPIHIYQ
jgi:hypothetical protein